MREACKRENCTKWLWVWRVCGPCLSSPSTSHTMFLGVLCVGLIMWSRHGCKQTARANCSMLCVCTQTIHQQNGRLAKVRAFSASLLSPSPIRTHSCPALFGLVLSLSNALLIVCVRVSQASEYYKKILLKEKEEGDENTTKLSYSAIGKRDARHTHTHIQRERAEKKKKKKIYKRRKTRETKTPHQALLLCNR